MKPADKAPGGGKGGPERAEKTCPLCGRPTEHRYRPFCSQRCADIDLGRWLTGAYAVPGPPADEEGNPVEE
jgi:endogenous inhibitor of DNA gyrase (YacG/DUF329 family)